MHIAKTRVCITLPTATLAQIDERAQAQALSRSAQASHLLQAALTGQMRRTALEQLAQAVIDRERAAPDDNSQEKTDMTNSPDFVRNSQQAQHAEANVAKPSAAPRSDGLTATGRDIQRHPNSMGQPAKGALSGGNMPSLGK